MLHKESSVGSPCDYTETANQLSNKELALQVMKSQRSKNNETKSLHEENNNPITFTKPTHRNRTPSRRHDSARKQSSAKRTTEKEIEQSCRRNTHKSESTESKVLSSTQLRIQKSIRKANTELLEELLEQQQQSNKKMEQMAY